MSTYEGVRVLVVDDDPYVLRATESVLKRQGWTVETARDGLDARKQLLNGPFDVIVSDVNMPGCGGLEFLRSVRERDLDVPVILMTGTPAVDSSIRAIEYGAFRYLIKPVPNDKLVEGIRHAVRLHKLARLKREALELHGGADRLGERAALEGRFTNSLDRIWVAFQPVVAWRARHVFGYEALLRSDEPLMKNPADMLDAAERLARIRDLGRVVRAKVAAMAGDPAVAGTLLFVNLHSSDLNDNQLYSADSPLSEFASRVVLEITERESLYGVEDMPARLVKLRAMGFRLAVDDLGVGYAGLTSFTLLEPEIVKLDMSLVRGVDMDSKRQSIIRSIKVLCDELNILVVAEGIETAGERDMLVELGCDLLQGYLFAKPERGFPVPIW
ncbi:MAG TPA: EAL domain-containing protein [Polyangiaceae bacterium]|nr:EAL domain-containing protein [Polyangiaceae bacterium]